MQTPTSDRDELLVEQMYARTVDLRRWQEYVGRIRGWICGRFPFLTTHAEDLAQETAIRAFVNLKSFRGDSPFIHWTFGVAYHVVCGHLRKNREMVVTSLEELTAEPSVDDGTQMTLQFWTISHAMRDMTSLERDVFVSRTAYDADHKDIARRLGISSNASRQTWMRAVQKVRRLDQEVPV